MLRVGFGRLKVGERTYSSGETLSPEDADLVRSRPGFDVLLEDEYLVVVDTPLNAAEETAGVNLDVVGVAQLQIEEQPVADEDGNERDELAPEQETEGFFCPQCDFVGKNSRSLAMHIRRAHPTEE